MKCSQARLPLDPLVAPFDGNDSAFARAYDLHLRQVHRWRVEGVPYYNADAIAVRTGSHPANVWGADWHRAGVEQTELEAAFDEQLADSAVRRWLRNRGRRQVRARAEQVEQYQRIERASCA